MSETYSFAKIGDKYREIKIEAKLNKGLPQVQVAGLPSNMWKSSLLRVKSAILNQGYEWSLSQTLAVSVNPSLSSKNSASELLDLPIAMAILQETGQLMFSSSRRLFALGEFSLDGAIEELHPEEEGLSWSSKGVLAGNFKKENSEQINIKKLSDFDNIKIKPQKKLKDNLSLPSYPDRLKTLSPAYGELFEVLVHGEHSCLFLQPENHELGELLLLVQESLRPLSKALQDGVRLVHGDRPFIQINSAITKGQILGSQGKGFYYHANGGMAYIQNLSALPRTVRDAIRGKVQGGSMGLGERARTSLFARNSLCPCGKAQLGKARKCGFSIHRCRSVLEKLSVDDFSVFDVVLSPQKNFFELYPHPDLDMVEMNKRRVRAFEMQKTRGQELANTYLDLFALKKMMSKQAKSMAYIPVVNSLDRTRSILSVARTVADLEGNEEIESDHIERAVLLAYRAAKEISKAF